uniref:Uncharacterized protein n=1 Tax=Palpitomonas bilix TaxID=652834 RepID=A0A7S3LUF3_9EUKA
MLINSVFILITASISLGIEFYHYATGAEEVSTIFYVFHLIVTVSFFLVMSVCTSFMFFHIYTIVVNRTTREHIKGLPGGTPSMEHVKDLFLAPLGPVYVSYTAVCVLCFLLFCPIHVRVGMLQHFMLQCT